MEWTPEIAVTVGGVFVGLIMVFSSLVAAFVLIVKKLGERADSALLGLMADQNEAQAKRDEAQTRQDDIQAENSRLQVENSRLQAEALTSLAESQESQAKSLEYLGQLHQGASTALTLLIEQFKPIIPMAASINNIEEQSKTMVTNMEELSSNSDQWVPLLKEIILRLEGVQQTLDDLNPVVSKTQYDLKETEREVAIIRGHVIDIQKAATQEQEVAVVNPEPIEQGAKPDERTIEQLDDLAGSSSGAGDDKRHGDGSGSEASDIAPVA